MELSYNSTGKKTEISEPAEEVHSEVNIHESPLGSDIEKPETNYTKLKQMHRDIKKIRQNAEISKAKFQVLRQIAENSNDGLKNEEEQGHKSIINDLCEISMQNSSSLWDEIKKTEAQVRILEEKVCCNKVTLASKKQKTLEIKLIMQEIESKKNLLSMKSSCSVCNIH